MNKKKEDFEPGSPEDLESKGLVPTWRQQLEQAAIESREGEFDAIEASAAEGEQATGAAADSKESKND